MTITKILFDVFIGFKTATEVKKIMKLLPASVSPRSNRSLSLIESRSLQKSKMRNRSKVGATKQPIVSKFR